MRKTEKPFSAKARRREEKFFSRPVFLCVLCALCALCICAANPAFAGKTPDEAAEKRFNAIVAELRCLVCQNESLAGSGAELAHDLRREIRNMIEAGKSDGEIMDFMVGRYGDFVRYRPPLKGSTLLLWFGPALLFAGGVGGLFVCLRRRARVGDAPLSEAERREAERLLHPEKTEA
ncbi:MAG: cytochrome c-type biogenesis protein CcmH [Candidatus Accumulibacter sp.]|jgi:cytochrome c-type biogenesis protein CcmH|nr:cytochrome c-type biogenesis protein CcmH [Accumulibacter sp.]